MLCIVIESEQSCLSCHAVSALDSQLLLHEQESRGNEGEAVGSIAFPLMGANLQRLRGIMACCHAACLTDVHTTNRMASLSCRHHLLLADWLSCLSLLAG